MKALNIIFKMLLLCLAAYGQITPDFIYRQGYLFDPTTPGPDSIGVGAASVYNSIPGWDGTGITVFDIEASWNLNHEDLPTNIQKVFGDDRTDTDHGTAVLGIIAGQHNGFGHCDLPIIF